MPPFLDSQLKFDIKTYTYLLDLLPILYCKHFANLLAIIQVLKSKILDYFLINIFYYQIAIQVQRW